MRATVHEDEVPENPAEELAKRVSDRLADTDVWCDWVADQVDGSLAKVVEAVDAEVFVQKAAVLSREVQARALRAAAAELENDVNRSPCHEWAARWLRRRAERIEQSG